jgi:Toxin PAAR-like domain
MGANVYANGREVSGKAASHKVLGSMPDVCLSPPSPPAGPIPIPYPNFAQASDTTGGSKKVKAGGKEIDLKGKSKYKKCKGDEAATRSFGGSVISHTITGAIKYVAGSFDVKVEGSSVVRHLDLTTGNHTNSTTGSLGPGAAKMAPAVIPDPECVELDKKNEADKDNLPERQSGAGNTNTNYKFKSRTKGVPSESRAAHSKVAVFHSDPKKYIEGNPASERKKAANPEGKSNVQCPEGESFSYSGEYFKGGHTEARIVERIFSNSNGGKVSGTLTMKIDWQPSGGTGQSCSPCEDCHALLCAAAKCGLTIYFCTKSNKKEKLNEDDDCEDNLDMTNPEVRAAMRKKNTKLKLRLDR